MVIFLQTVSFFIYANENFKLQLEIGQKKSNFVRMTFRILLINIENIDLVQTETIITDLKDIKDQSVSQH